MSRPDIAEKSKGLPGNPLPGIPGPGAVEALSPAGAGDGVGESLEDVSSLEVLFSAVPALSSNKISTCVKLMHFQDSRKLAAMLNCQH